MCYLSCTEDRSTQDGFQGLPVLRLRNISGNTLCQFPGDILFAGFGPFLSSGGSHNGYTVLIGSEDTFTDIVGNDPVAAF